MSEETLETLLQRARSKSHQRDPITAVQLYRQALTADPDSADAMEGLAMVFFQAGDWPSAVEQFIRLTQLQPYEARHHVNLGAVYNRTGQHKQATIVLRKAIQRDRNCADAYYNLGIAQRKLNQPSLAISAYKEAIRIDPMRAETYQNLANVYLEIHNYQLAILNFNKALEIRPDFPKARLGLSRAEDALAQSKAVRDPLGRLVSTANLDSKWELVIPSADVDVPPLDRAQVQALAQALQRSTEEYRDLMKTQLELRLHNLQRAVAESGGNMALAGAITEFEEVFELWQQRSREVRQRATEFGDALAH
ncbi:MAG TPA: tetratricopeptide repeat protein [Planctomycetaceae bacterium]|nr:tetratricopeptide repeat protein [Planctomycetaceae bacterium]